MRIGLCGTHCSGKTTLSGKLAKSLGLPLINEVAASYTEKDRKYVYIQLEILQTQIERELASNSFVSDRTVFDNFAYLQYHATRNNFIVTIEEVQDIIDRYMKMHPYDYVVFINEFFPLVDNGQRNMELDQQKEIYDFLKVYAPAQCNKFNIPMISIAGNTSNRVQTITDHIQCYENYPK
jgi:nicotinamide riboside kinase